LYTGLSPVRKVNSIPGVSELFSYDFIETTTNGVWLSAEYVAPRLVPLRSEVAGGKFKETPFIREGLVTKRDGELDTAPRV
jgi:hypothetical protein